MFIDYEIGQEVIIELEDGSYETPVLISKGADVTGPYFYFSPSIVVSDENVNVKK